MNLIEESYSRLFPGKGISYRTKLGYNRRLSDFNANIRLRQNHLAVNLNLKWKNIDDEIKIGLIQSLLLRLLKQKAHTSNIELYNNFVKNIPAFAEKTETDPILEASFCRINGQFFLDQVEKPNLKWGQPSFRKLASYNFHNDMVVVSTIFKKAPSRILDYLMYHELLHKHHQFRHRNGRSAFHTPEFRRAEKLYPNQELVEREIQQIIRSTRKVSWKRFLEW